MYSIFGYLFYITYIGVLYLLPLGLSLTGYNFDLFLLVTICWLLVVSVSYFILKRGLESLDRNIILAGIKYRKFIFYVLFVLIIGYLSYQANELRHVDLLTRIAMRDGSIVKTFISASILIGTAYLMYYSGSLNKKTMIWRIFILFLCMIIYFFVYLDRSIIAYTCFLMLSIYLWGKLYLLILMLFAKGLLDILNSIRFGDYEAISIARFFNISFGEHKAVQFLADSLMVYNLEVRHFYLLVDSLLLPIPRVVWTEKPDLSPTLFLTNFMGYNDGIGRPMPVYGEFIVSMGTAGILVGGILTALALACTDTIGNRLDERRQQSVLRAFLAVTFLGGVGLSTPARLIPIIVIILVLGYASRIRLKIGVK